MKKNYLLLACLALFALLQSGFVKAQNTDYSVSFFVDGVSAGSTIYIPPTGRRISYNGFVQNSFTPQASLSGYISLYVKVDGQPAKKLGTDIAVSGGGPFPYLSAVTISQADIYGSPAKLYTLYTTNIGIPGATYKSVREYTIERGAACTSSDPALPVNQPKNLVGIKKSGTASGKTEVYMSANCSGTLKMQTYVTALGPTNSDWEFKIADWNKDGFLDLIGIKKNNTTYNGVEIHVLSGATGFTSFIYQKSTAFWASTDWELEISDYDGDTNLDLVGILRSNTGTGKAEIHVLRQANDFSRITDSRATAFPMSLTDWEYEAVDYDNDGHMDIVGLKKNNTGTGKTEIHVATYAMTYSELIHSRATPFPLSTATSPWEFDIVDNDGDGYLDISGVKKSGTDTGTSESHFAMGSELYQNIRLSSSTTFPQTDATWEFCHPDVSKKIAGGRIATSGDNLTNNTTLFAAYPNPTSDVLVIAFSEPAIAKGAAVEARLFNANSLVLKSNRVQDGKMVLSVKELPSGLYYLQVQAGREVIKQKVVVLHQ